MTIGRRAVVLAVVAGCGFQLEGGAGPGDAVRIDAPGDAAIDAREVDAPIDALDDTDDDDDGVLDVADNCPLTPNPNQHNEDADTKGDLCDPCPQILGIDTDADGDGIGDSCDPHLSVPGDVLVVFDGFPTAGSLPTGWTQIGGFPGDWGMSGDALRLDTHDTPHLLQFNAQGGHTTIDLLIDASLPGTNVPSLTAIVDGDATLTTFTACSVLYVEQSRRLQSFAAGVFTSSIASAGIVTVPGTHRIVATTDATSVGCGFTPGGGMMASLASLGRMSVGMRIRNLRVAIHYVAIYRSP